MRLTDILDKNCIFLKLDGNEKYEILQKIVSLMAQNNVIQNADDFMEELWQRENQGSTAIGDGIAIPHARVKELETIVMAIAILKKGIDFGAEDAISVKLIFLLGAPQEMAGEYLKVLGKLSRLLKEKDMHKKLLKAGSSSEVFEIMEEAERQLANN
jgi:fructose-specific phosphotransferase system IIA component